MPKSSHRGAWPGSGRSVKEPVRKMPPLRKAAQMSKSGHRGAWPGNGRSVKECVREMAPLGEGRPNAEIWPQRRPPPSEYLQNHPMYRQTASKRKRPPSSETLPGGGCTPQAVANDHPGTTRAHNQPTDGSKEGHPPPIRNPPGRGGTPPKATNIDPSGDPGGPGHAIPAKPPKIIELSHKI